jgi:hypothetical protein
MERISLPVRNERHKEYAETLRKLLAGERRQSDFAEFTLHESGGNLFIFLIELPRSAFVIRF